MNANTVIYDWPDMIRLVAEREALWLERRSCRVDSLDEDASVDVAELPEPTWVPCVKD